MGSLTGGEFFSVSHVEDVKGRKQGFLLWVGIWSRWFLRQRLEVRSGGVLRRSTGAPKRESFLLVFLAHDLSFLDIYLYVQGRITRN